MLIPLTCLRCDGLWNIRIEFVACFLILNLLLPDFRPSQGQWLEATMTTTRVLWEISFLVWNEGWRFFCVEICVVVWDFVLLPISHSLGQWGSTAVQVGDYSVNLNEFEAWFRYLATITRPQKRSIIVASELTLAFCSAYEVTNNSHGLRALAPKKPKGDEW